MAHKISNDMSKNEAHEQKKRAYEFLLDDLEDSKATPFWKVSMSKNEQTLHAEMGKLAEFVGITAKEQSVHELIRGLVEKEAKHAYNSDVFVRLCGSSAAHSAHGSYLADVDLVLCGLDASRWNPDIMSALENEADHGWPAHNALIPLYYRLLSCGWASSKETTIVKKGFVHLQSIFTRCALPFDVVLESSSDNPTWVPEVAARTKHFAVLVRAFKVFAHQNRLDDKQTGGLRGVQIYGLTALSGSKHEHEVGHAFIALLQYIAEFCRTELTLGKAKVKTFTLGKKEFTMRFPHNFPVMLVAHACDTAVIQLTKAPSVGESMLERVIDWPRLRDDRRRRFDQIAAALGSGSSDDPIDLTVECKSNRSRSEDDIVNV